MELASARLGIRRTPRWMPVLPAHTPCLKCTLARKSAPGYSGFDTVDSNYSTGQAMPHKGSRAATYHAPEGRPSLAQRFSAGKECDDDRKSRRDDPPWSWEGHDLVVPLGRWKWGLRLSASATPRPLSAILPQLMPAYTAHESRLQALQSRGKPRLRVILGSAPSLHAAEKRRTGIRACPLACRMRQNEMRLQALRAPRPIRILRSRYRLARTIPSRVFACR
jgi:hypothetical protein